MIKIKASYENESEMIQFMSHLQGKILKIKHPKENTGRFKKCYIDLEPVTGAEFEKEND